MPLSWNEIKSRAMAFSRKWEDAGYERGQSAPFWIDFFEVFGITDKRVASFELAVKRHGGAQGFVDLFWPGQMLVEHKSRGKPLEPAFAQALDYFPGIRERELPHTLVVCDFARFRITDLRTRETIEFALKDLHKHVRRFAFVAGYKAQEIRPQDPVNIRAAERMGRLHDALKAAGYEGHPLEVLLVRLLFCMFADDTGIFTAQSFRSYIEERTAADGSDLGSQLAHVFQVLNTPDGAGGPDNTQNKRSARLDEQLTAFPYINGKLFAEVLPMADFDTAMREALLDACALDWSRISPAVFGALFQSIMDADARRNLGAHYTSEENILKLIGPLFLDQLRAEFQRVKGNRARLLEFHKKLRTLTFFDPACGCGNFLVISYRELRELELDVLRIVHQAAGSRFLDIHSQIAVNVDQFHGIEIEEFPAQIAQVAMWLVDHQMNIKVGEEFGAYYARIPLRTSPNVMHANALHYDWEHLLPATRCTYLLGNPPFVGAKLLSDEQREDVRKVFTGIDNAGLLDFVASWYVKATRYMHAAAAQDPRAVPRCAFVSTNSIAQGEQVGALWSWMLAQGVHIHFAHRTFSWSNEASGKAAVHCVIIGFGLDDAPGKTIFEYEDIKGDAHAVAASNINPYLVDAPDVVLPRRSKPICDVPSIGIGNKPIDDGNYLFSLEEMVEFVKREPASKKFFRRWLGADEMLKGTQRWCLWLGDCSPAELRAMPEAMKRAQAVKAFRLASKSAPTRALAQTPTRFHVHNMPKGPYLVFPRHSSETRQFLPLGFAEPSVLTGDACLMTSAASPYHFGVLSSTMHNAWIRAVCGRLESRFRYSAAIVYNNFPWPQPSPAQQAAIEAAAEEVLNARARFVDSSLADLYDPVGMPPVLAKAHQKLDAAVDKAYESDGGRKNWGSDAQRVAFLFERYQALTSRMIAAGKPAAKRRRVA